MDKEQILPERNSSEYLLKRRRGADTYKDVQVEKVENETTIEQNSLYRNENLEDIIRKDI